MQHNQTTGYRQSLAELRGVCPGSIIADAAALIKDELGAKRVVSADCEALSDVFGPLSRLRDADASLARREGGCSTGEKAEWRE
jgi:hypothetical protein